MCARVGGLNWRCEMDRVGWVVQSNAGEVRVTIGLETCSPRFVFQAMAKSTSEIIVMHPVV